MHPLTLPGPLRSPQPRTNSRVAPTATTPLGDKDGGGRVDGKECNAQARPVLRESSVTQGRRLRFTLEREVAVAVAGEQALL